MNEATKINLANRFTDTSQESWFALIKRSYLPQMEGMSLVERASEYVAVNEDGGRGLLVNIFYDNNDDLGDGHVVVAVKAQFVPKDGGYVGVSGSVRASARDDEDKDYILEDFAAKFGPDQMGVDNQQSIAVQLMRDLYQLKEPTVLPEVSLVLPTGVEEGYVDVGLVDVTAPEDMDVSLVIDGQDQGSWKLRKGQKRTIFLPEGRAAGNYEVQIYRGQAATKALAFSIAPKQEELVTTTPTTEVISYMTGSQKVSVGDLSVTLEPTQTIKAGAKDETVLDFVLSRALKPGEVVQISVEGSKFKLFGQEVKGNTVLFKGPDVPSSLPTAQADAGYVTVNADDLGKGGEWKITVQIGTAAPQVLWHDVEVVAAAKVQEAPPLVLDNPVSSVQVGNGWQHLFDVENSPVAGSAAVYQGSVKVGDVILKKGKTNPVKVDTKQLTAAPDGDVFKVVLGESIGEMTIKVAEKPEAPKATITTRLLVTGPLHQPAVTAQPVLGVTSDVDLPQPASVYFDGTEVGKLALKAGVEVVFSLSLEQINAKDVSGGTKDFTLEVRAEGDVKSSPVNISMTPPQEKGCTVIRQRFLDTKGVWINRKEGAYYGPTENVRTIIGVDKPGIVLVKTQEKKSPIKEEVKVTFTEEDLYKGDNPLLQGLYVKTIDLHDGKKPRSQNLFYVGFYQENERGEFDKMGTNWFEFKNKK